MRQSLSQPSPVIHNRVSVNVNGHTHMYAYYDGDEAEIAWVIEKHVAIGNLPPLAGYVLRSIIFLEEDGED